MICSRFHRDLLMIPSRYAAGMVHCCAVLFYQNCSCILGGVIIMSCNNRAWWLGGVFICSCLFSLDSYGARNFTGCLQISSSHHLH